jgi:taurine dioxygenase
MVELERITSRIGAKVRGLDLSHPLDAASVAAISAAIDEHAVLFFVDQPKLTGAQQLAFARQFGAIEISPFRTRESVLPEVMILEWTQPKGSGTDVWHADGTFQEKPPMGSILQAHVLPPVGGDTCFACMAAAYDALSPSLQAMFDGLTARHSAAQPLARTLTRNNYSFDTDAAPRAVSHPIVTVHPKTGRRRLFVNPNYTEAIDGLSKAESDHWLAFLYEHVKSPEFQVRYRWAEGDIAFWDNHDVQHYAVADYDSRRVMQRVTLLGDRPIGVDGVSASLKAASALT